MPAAERAPRQESEALLAALQDAGFEFIVIGGVAAIAHGATRSTKDLDVCAPMTPENLDRLRTALEPHQPRHLLRPDLGVIRASGKDLSQYRVLLLSTAVGRLDVLGTVDPIGGYGRLEAVELSLVDGRPPFRVLALDQLIQVKSHLGRPHDRAVEQELRVVRALRKEGPPAAGGR